MQPAREKELIYQTTKPVQSTVSEEQLIPVLPKRKRTKFYILTGIWVLCFLFFWQWWLRPEHNIGWVRYATVTFALAWLFCFELFFLSMFLRARRPNGPVPDPRSARVAMVVTKAPSEPFSMLKLTLEAMLAQDYPHDTWLADEDPSDETVRWCKSRGVKISSRKGVEEYHRPVWPRRTRCKEGNLAYFYDKYGYENYDFVIQLDADHVPQNEYLKEMLRPFNDPDVGYVSAPSICGSNAASSWAARARLYSETMFHGVFQAGYSNGWAPMCIGSHYGVRTSALKQVGGLGPDLAEDHSTSMIMNSHGWKGVHAINATAIGAGPASVADMVTQEFQWSRSLVTILLKHTPGYFKGLRPIKRFQFLFLQLWYPLFALVMGIIYVMPILALTLGVPFANVTFPEFMLHAMPAVAVLILITFQARKDGLFRPLDGKILCWEKSLFPYAQWPWVLAGCLVAVKDRLSGKFVDFRITPKGDDIKQNLPFTIVLPYFLLAAGSLIPVILCKDVGDAGGFYILALLNVVFYCVLLTVVILMHHKENGITLWATFPGSAIQYGMIGTIVFLGVVFLNERGMHSIHALSKGAGPVQLTDVKFVVSGAGSAKTGQKSIYFAPELHIDWSEIWEPVERLSETYTKKHNNENTYFHQNEER